MNVKGTSNAVQVQTSIWTNEAEAETGRNENLKTKMMIEDKKNTCSQLYLFSFDCNICRVVSVLTVLSTSVIG